MKKEKKGGRGETTYMYLGGGCRVSEGGGRLRLGDFVSGIHMLRTSLSQNITLMYSIHNSSINDGSPRSIGS